VLYSRLGLPPPTDIHTKGTVSIAIIELANWMGIEKICFVGQDLALTREGRTHTKDSFYEGTSLEQSDVTDALQIPANHGAPVPITPALFAYLRFIEEEIRKLPTVQFLNTAYDGAKIQGAPYASFEDALEWLGQPQQERFAAKLKTIHQQKPAIEVGKLLKAIEPTAAFTKKVLLLATKLAHAHEQLPEKLAQPMYAENSQVRKALKMANEINDLIDTHPRDYKILFDGLTKKELVDYGTKCPTIRAEAPTPHWAMLMQNKEYYWALAEGAWFLVKELEKLQESLETTPADASARCQ